MVILLAIACIRPSDEYEVRLYQAGTALDEVQPAPQPMGGAIEWVRFSLWGTNLGSGVTGLYGDAPRSDGLSFVIGNGELAYPPDPGYDRYSPYVRSGPVVADRDACQTSVGIRGWPGVSEYVDVGDHIALVAPDGDTVTLERDPAAHHPSAGESWYAGYGQVLVPSVTGHEVLPDTWAPNETWAITWPGMVLPESSTMGMIPLPLSGQVLRLPPTIDGLEVGGTPVRPPHHEYAADGTYVEGLEDDVRFPGPWDEPVSLTWTPSASAHPLTVTVQYLGTADEGACGCSTDCGPGFACEEGTCRGVDGATSNVLGEVTCTALDDGAFTLEPRFFDELDRWVAEPEVRGALLVVSRIVEGEIQVPDVRTHNGRRISITPVRTRTADIVVTRWEWP